MSPPLLFDRRLLALRRSRPAFRPGVPGFLLDRACEEISDRLDSLAPRRFAAALDLGAQDGRLTALLGGKPFIGLTVATESSLALAAALPDPKAVCDEDLLPFRDQAFDLIVSALALHLVNDLPGALIQIRKALRPGGLFLAALFGGATLSELREVLTAAELETKGGASPRVAPMADVRDCGALLQRAGFARPVADSDRFTVTYPTALALLREARAISGGNVLAQRSRTPLARTTLARAIQLYEERHGTEDGRVRASFEILFLTGQAPAAGDGGGYVSHLQQD